MDYLLEKLQPTGNSCMILDSRSVGSVADFLKLVFIVCVVLFIFHKYLILCAVVGQGGVERLSEMQRE